MEKKTNSKPKTNDSKKVEMLQKQLEDMQAMMNKLLMGNVATPSRDRDVTFISLFPGILNLSTEGNGNGSVYTFTSFGEEQSISYSDAKLLIKNNKSFIKDGKAYIADEELISSEKLTKDYEKILDKDSLLELFNKDKKSFVKIFSIMTKSQKEIFAKMVERKLLKEEDVDMNIVNCINSELGIDIVKNIENGKGFISDTQE